MSKMRHSPQGADRPNGGERERALFPEPWSSALSPCLLWLLGKIGLPNRFYFIYLFIYLFTYLLTYLLTYLFILGPNLQHVEVPRLGVKSEL